MNKISGFTFIRNGLTLNYPFLEGIQSIAALCDEVIINVAFDDPELKNDDGTWNYLNTNLKGPQFKFIKSYWDKEMDRDGLILSHHTNLALNECQNDFCHYIQGDEAIHEEDHSAILRSVDKMRENQLIQGLVYQYIHFYGNTDIFKHTRNVYRREVRLIRRDPNIISHKDAQGFKLKSGQKISCIETKARIFHYGWAREKEVMNQKIKAFNKLYHGHQFEPEKQFEYERIWGLRPFKQTHPELMKKWIQENHNDLDIMSLPIKNEWKNVGLAISDFIENLTGYRMGEYKNFILLKE